MDGRERFEQDLSTLMLRLAAGMEKESETKLSNLRDWLLKLQKENVNLKEDREILKKALAIFSKHPK